ncbi:MAG: leucyl aminopeptidase [Fusobacteriaceae bacterium]|nr:leucyl aminopeptidase [Fusobacteriaceae bacterium]
MSLIVTNKINKKYTKYITIFFEDKVSVCPHIPEESKKFIKNAIIKENFNGKMGEIFKISYPEKDDIIDIIYIGAGKKESFNKIEYRNSLFKSLSSLKGEKGELSVFSPSKTLNDANIVAEVLENINYSFDKYRAVKNESLKLELFTEELQNIDETLNICQAANYAKDLVNEQAEIMTPENLSLISKEQGEKCGFEVEILEEDRIKELKMNAFLSVGRGAKNKPHLIVMRYFGDKESDYVYGLVGKGITFDTGGLCLKGRDTMGAMKDDMGGAATTIAAMMAIAKNRLKKNVIAVIPACENSIGPNSYRPSDIVESMSGKFIEITNTDAEGRVILADALTYIIQKEKISEVVDIATLTGAISVSLGTTITGVFTNKLEMFKKLDENSKKWGEAFWNMPIADEHRSLLKTDIADIKNSAGVSTAGACTGAAFLENFVEGKPWMHLDIGGTVFLGSDKEFLRKGATGVAVKSLYEYIKN